ncbi:MAG: DEAD/DEAH box helicase family protein [Deltaproteobacteria bacterium]|nr:DEAD/DEAH box helicase family protein [Deltaproteobacteria bacterium]
MKSISNKKENYFYDKLTEKRQDSKPLKHKMEETVRKLMENDTTINKPGMLLGKIQSGKTRAFIGVIALSFDKGYDIAIILTKGTKALAEQTYNRLEKDFSEFIEVDEVQIRDIMHLPDELSKYELMDKQVFVVKKQTHNLDRIIKALTETYPDLSKKFFFIVDNEADYASIGFRKERKDIELYRS